MKNDAKYEEELICQFKKIEIRNLTNFHLSSQKSQFFYLNELFLTKV